MNEDHKEKKSSPVKLTLVLVLLPVLVVALMMVFWFIFKETRNHTKTQSGHNQVTHSATAIKWQQLYANNRSWLDKDIDRCPADLLPKQTLDVGYSEGACDTRMSQCLSACKNGDASSCFNLGVEIQTIEQEPADQFSEALFKQACILGSALACTNRAAGMDFASGLNSGACATRTYQHTCQQGDTWGCSMYGFHLAHGKGVEQDLELAKTYLIKACDIDSDTEACWKASKLLKKLNDSESAVNDSQ